MQDDDTRFTDAVFEMLWHLLVMTLCTVIVLWLFVGLSVSLADQGAERLLTAGCNLTLEPENNLVLDCEPLGLCFFPENVTAFISYFQREELSVFRCENVTRSDWIRFVNNYYPGFINPFSTGNVGYLNLANALDRVYSFWWIALSFLKEGKGKKSQNARLVVGAVLASLWSAFLVGIFLYELGDLTAELTSNGLLVVSTELTILAIVATFLLVISLIILSVYGFWSKKKGKEETLEQQFEKAVKL
jgi:hypothetical protein